MENLVWWIITVILGLNVMINFYNAGKGEYTRTNDPTTSIVAGLIALVFFLWGLITLL